MSAAPGADTLAAVMTRSVHVVAPFSSIRSAARLIEENHISALPVVDAEGTVVGVVSAADLVGQIAGGSRLGAVAADVMTSPPVVARPATPIREAARLMYRRHLQNLPVVDAAGRLQGIVSRGDLLRYFLGCESQLAG